jgi:hypothetical protein
VYVVLALGLGLGLMRRRRNRMEKKRAACAERDAAQVPAEEAEECVHNLARPVWGR